MGPKRAALLRQSLRELGFRHTFGLTQLPSAGVYVCAGKAKATLHRSLETQTPAQSSTSHMAATLAAEQNLPSLTADFYDTLGANYESAFGHDEGLTKFIHKALSFFKPSSRVLDVGCGTGTPVASTIAQHGHRVTGIDIAPSMVELSRKAVPNGKFEVASMLEYNPKESVDVVLNILSLFMLSREDLEVSMSRKWLDWLVSGGLLCIATIPLDSYNLSKDLYDEDGLCARKIPAHFMGQRFELAHMSKEFWEQLLEKTGFEILHTEDDLFVPPADAKSESEMHFYIIARKKL